MASDGLPRLELFKGETLVDTVQVHRFSAAAITDLLVDMGQERDMSRSWESLKAEKELFKAFNDL